MVCVNCKKKFDALRHNVIRGYGKHCSKRCSNLANGFGFKKGHPDYLTEESKKILAECSRTRKRSRWGEKSKKKLSASLRRYWDKVGRKKCGYRKRKCQKCIEWRKKIYERDNYTCQYCGLRGVYLEAHHIKSWKFYPKERHKLNNGLTLCLECHKKTPNYKKKALKQI